MEDFIPKEIVRYVEARWSFSFLDEPKAILDKVLFWLIFGGELQFRERDSIRIENFITLGSMGIHISMKLSSLNNSVSSKVTAKAT